MTKNKNSAFLLTALILLALAAYGGYLWTNQPEQAADMTETEMDDAEMAETVQEDADVEGGPAAVEYQSSDTEDGLGIRAIGNPDAPVRMVEYASLTCSHCRSFHLNTLPDLKKRYVENGDLYIRFEEFPLNAPALDAAVLARCLPAERYYGFVDLLFKTQESWSHRPDYRTALIQNAKLAGLSEDEANECLENKKMREALAGRIQAVTQNHKISSTPTFIVNEGEEVISGAQPLYNFESVFRKVSNNEVAPIKEQETE